MRLAWRAAPWTAQLAAPLATGAGAIAARSGWYLTCAGDGLVGLGEVVPWPAWGTESPADVAAFLTAWPAEGPAPEAIGGVAGALTALGLDAARTPALWAGAELALLDWLARRAGVSLAALLWVDVAARIDTDGATGATQARIASAIPVAALISGDAPDVAARAASAAVAAGHTVVKLKVTGADDVPRVAAVRAAVGPHVALRLDANAAWPDAAAAAPHLAAFAPYRPAFVEQPVPAADRAGLARLAAGLVPVAADEALGWPGAASELLAAGVPVLVVKPMVTGGLLAARQLIGAARAVGAEVVLSSALDRGVGTAGALHLAAACGGLPPAGLGTAGWWADGGALAGLVPVGGDIAIPTGPGLGFEVVDADLRALVANAPFCSLGGFVGRLDRRGAPAERVRGGTPGAESPLTAPQHPALIAPDGQTWSHAYLDALVDLHAARLAAHGLTPGGTLALWGPNTTEWVITARAAWRLGAALLPLPPRWTTAEAANVLARARPHLVIGPPELVAHAAALGYTALGYDALDAAGHNPHATSPVVHLPPPSPDRLAAIVPTSGTTGIPKLACLTAAGLAATADATAAALGLGPGDTYWLPLPLHHVGGLGALWRAWRSGAALRLGPDGDGATHASLVPTQLLDLADHAWPPALRAVMVGGAAPPADLAARCPAAWATYGLTEGGGTVTLSPAGDAAGTAGRPLPGWSVAILGEGGEALPPGSEGAIALRGPGLMAGYLDDPSATAAALADGWLRTGDLGQLDEAGRLIVLGRRDDLIVSGGENVYPAEVEAALRAHPAIADAAVVAAPDPRWGQVPVAFAVPHADAIPPDLASLRTFLTDRLARYKHPHALTWLPTLPRLATGKVDRRMLRDRAPDVRV